VGCGVVKPFLLGTGGSAVPTKTQIPYSKHVVSILLANMVHRNKYRNKYEANSRQNGLAKQARNAQHGTRKQELALARYAE
jgi:hypothetical protein